MKCAKIFALIICAVIAFQTLPSLVFAAARTTPFSVGETLDPGLDAEPCGPTDANCFPASWTNSEGLFQVTGAAYSSPGAPSNAVMDNAVYDPSYNYENCGYPHAIRVYAYKDSPGGRIYSSSYAQSATFTDNNDCDGALYMVWSWDAGSGADGYRVLKYDPNYNGFDYDYHYDTTSTSFIDGDYSAYFEEGGTVTPTSFGSGGIAVNDYGSLFTVTGDTLFSGLNRYLNFGSATSSSGYGIRDNEGAVEYKNSTGSWSSLGGPWTNNGTGALSYSAGSVGISTTTPWAKLSVVNSGSSPSFLVDDQGGFDSSPFIIDANGNIGIGTTSPNRKVVLNGVMGFYGSGGNREAGYLSATTDATGGYVSLGVSNSVGSSVAYTASSPANGIINHTFNLANSSIFLIDTAAASSFRVKSAGTEIFSVGNGGGVTASTQYVTTQGATTTLNSGSGDFDFIVNGVGSNLFYADAGNLRVGISTSTPWKKFSVTGAVAFDGLTNSGTGNYVCVTSAKEITYSATACAGVSSQQYKHDIATLTGNGLDQINALRPVSFIYNTDISPGDQSTHLGFIAEEVAEINPSLAAYDADGKIRSVKYDEFAPVIVKALQELDKKLSGTLERINDLFVGTIHIEDKVCVDDVCVSKEQFKAMLLQAGGTTGDSAPIVAPTPTPTPTSSESPVATETPSPSSAPESVTTEE